MLKIIVILAVVALLCPGMALAPAEGPQTDCIKILEGFQYHSNKIFVMWSEVSRQDAELFAIGMRDVMPRRRIWIEVYIAIGDRIHLHKIIVGKVTPAVKEKWSFDDFNIGDYK
jgi:hypothetical protein